MYAHHQQTIARLADRCQADPTMLALIIVGSVARGDAHAGSDVDCYLVATDAEYQRRLAAGATGFNADDPADYPDGHAGGPIVDLAFLHDMAARGSEPARFAFVNARIAWARLSDLEPVLARIPVYPEAERLDKMAGFVSQLPVHLAYLKLGEYSSNPYLLAQPAVELVLFGGRLLLAHNRLLYPGRKHFLREIERAPDKPAGIVDLARRLLSQPSIALATEFCDRILGFADWPQPPEGHWERFRRDRELHWRSGSVPLADC